MTSKTWKQQIAATGVIVVNGLAPGTVAAAGDLRGEKLGQDGEGVAVSGTIEQGLDGRASTPSPESDVFQPFASFTGDFEVHSSGISELLKTASAQLEQFEGLETDHEAEKELDAIMARKYEKESEELL